MKMCVCASAYVCSIHACMRLCAHMCFVFVCVSVCAYACVVEKLVYNVMAPMLEFCVLGKAPSYVNNNC